MSDATVPDPVITASCGQCGGEWQRTGRGEEEVRQVIDACRDHEEAAGHQVVWTVEYARHSEHLNQSDADLPAALPWDSWPAWVKRDGTAGVPHYRPDGTECAYLGMIICNKCGWVDTDAERIQRTRELLEAARVTTEALRAEQRKAWRKALSEHNAAKRRGRVRRPAKPVTGYVVPPPQKRGETR